MTLYHADCREVAPTLAAGSVALVLTDPPYGHNNNNGDLIHRREAALGRGESPPEAARPIANDGAGANELVRWLFAESARLLVSGGGVCCCCCGGGPDPQFARWSLWMDEVLDFKQMVIWDKGLMGMGWHYRRSYETVLVGQKKKSGKTRWFDTTHRVENIIRPGFRGIKKVIPKKTDHPTPKPVALMRFFMDLHTAPGDLVFDPFAGSGPVLEAAAESGRRAVGVEVSEEFCEMAARRLEKFRSTQQHGQDHEQV